MQSVTPEFLARLVDQHGGALVLFARQWGDGAEDVVQDAFLKFMHQTTPPRDCVAWLYTVVRNASISKLRSKKRRQRYETAGARTAADWFHATPDSQLHQEEATKALKQLPLEQREVIVARLWGNLTFEQIATLTQSSSSSAHRRYEAGLAALKNLLEPRHPTDAKDTSSCPTKI